MGEKHDIRSGRVTEQEYEAAFCDLHPPLNPIQAATEASRCYFCHDAPCVQACPTKINIPNFIRKIQTDNLKGSALDILSSNILGGTCSRVCPVETLCEEKCVRNKAEDKPVTIGFLQRYATDWLFKNGIQPFKRMKETGKKIAVIGAGPAGLSCAHRLSVLGHQVEIFEARGKAGGLNEYGIAAYKMADDFAQKEVDFVLSVGGIKVHYGQALGQHVQLDALRKKYDAVLLGVGLAGTNPLGCEGENLPGVLDAVKFIEQIRQAKHLKDIAIGRRVIVIGGGNTAIDMAIQAKRLGAEEVTLVYRRGPEQMGATWYEQELAQKNGVLLRYWSKPIQIQGDNQGVSAVSFERTLLVSGKLQGTGERYVLPADMVFKAIGQTFDAAKAGASGLEIANGKIKVNDQLQTSLQGVFAGGDCIDTEDLTVAAVQDGKRAAHSIDQMLMSRDSNEVFEEWVKGGGRPWRT